MQRFAVVDGFEVYVEAATPPGLFVVHVDWARDDTLLEVVNWADNVRLLEVSEDVGFEDALLYLASRIAGETPKRALRSLP